MCLEQWNMDQYNMLQILEIQPMSNRCKYLLLTTMHDNVSNNNTFPTGVFERHILHIIVVKMSVSANFVSPFANSQYLYSVPSVPSVIRKWNTLPFLTKQLPILFLSLNNR